MEGENNACLPTYSVLLLPNRKAKQATLTMPKDFEDPPKEPAKDRASRRWGNHDIRRRFKEAQAQPTAKEPKEPEIAATINNDALKSGAITKAETMFARYLRELMEGNAREHLKLYIISIRAQRRRLLIEKLRRLEARLAQPQPQPQPQPPPQPQQVVKKDLFA